MNRRRFLTGATGALTFGVAGGLATPAISQRVAARTLRLVPHADVANFDPIWNVAYIARNAGALVWDTLYGVDAALQPQRQMVESEDVTADGLAWTFRLRGALKFHDGEPVRAQDAVASINRWAGRQPMGQMIKAREHELAAIDDRTFRWRLKTPFPKLRLALGRLGTPCCFIMPARIAATDPFRQISEHIGSGPMRFAKSEWVPGSRAVFEKFADYVPRAEPASWFAGGKRMLVDRMEWVIIPDSATAAAALQSGEVDWWEVALPDLVPTLRRNRNVAVDISDPLGWFGFLLFNHRHPPFNDVRARRAVMMAINQADYMRAFVGDDDAMWKRVPGFFTPDTPLYTEEGGDILKGERRLDAAKRLLAESGYAGEPIVCMAAQDIAHHKAWGDVTADLLRRLDINLDFIAADFGTVVARRAQKAPPAQGGWHLYHTSFAGADCLDPTNGFLRANGNVVVNGWADVPPVEAGISAWYEAKNLEEEKSIVGRLNRDAVENVVYAPLGFYRRHQAWHRNIAGVGQGPLPFCWGVSKNA